MRIFRVGLAWMALAFPPAAVRAYPPAAAESRLDAVLREWGAASEKGQEAHFTVRVSDLDSVTGEIRRSRLVVFVKKPDLMRVDHVLDDGRLDFAFVYRDGMLHEFSGGDRTETHVRLSRDFGFPTQPDRYPDSIFQGRLLGWALERLSWVAVGLPVSILKDRFDVCLTHEDDAWIYLELKPLKGNDRDDFRRMEVVLNRKTFGVRRLWLEYLNSTQWTYDFDGPAGGSEEAVTADSILKGLPADYKKIDLRLWDERTDRRPGEAGDSPNKH